MRLFGSENITKVVDRMGMADNEALQSSMLSNAIERAQRKVEENHFGVRKRLVEYDDVMNSQREVVYTRRRSALTGDRIDVDVLNMIGDYCDIFYDYNKDLDYEGFSQELVAKLSITPNFDEEFYNRSSKDKIVEKLEESLKENMQQRFDKIIEMAWPIVKGVYDTKRMFYENILIPVTDNKKVYSILVNLRKAYDTHGKEIIRCVEKAITLRVIDEYWKEHLREMDDLKQSVQNVAYEQKDPVLVYKTESFNLFIGVLENISKDVLAFLLRSQIFLRQEQDAASQVSEGHEKHTDMSRMQTSRPDLMTNGSQPKSNQPVHVEKKVGRNDPCPCGSGKKFKNCHGRDL